jgi:MoaA/NifB/PqqE/SkfB family radical SAM enzyme
MVGKKTIAKNKKLFCEQIPQDILIELQRHCTGYWNSRSSAYYIPVDIYYSNFVFLSVPCLFNPDDQSVEIEESMLPSKPDTITLSKKYDNLIYWNKIKSLSANGEVIQALGCIKISNDIAIDAVNLTLDIVTNRILTIDGVEWDSGDRIKAALSPLNRKSDIPHVLKVELTQYCNLECSYCTHQYLNSKSKLTFKQLFDYADMSVYKRVGKVSFTGLGESMLANNLWKAIELFNNANVVTSLVTNGMLLNRNIEKILKLQLNSLAVTLDTTNSDLFELNRKHSSYNEVVSGIKNFIKTRNQMNADTQLGIICPYDPRSSDEAIKVVEFCSSHGLSTPKLYPLYDFSTDSTSPELLYKSFDVIKSSIKKYYGSVPIYLCREERLLKRPMDGFICNEPNEIMVLRAGLKFDVCHESIFKIDCNNCASHLEQDWNSWVFNSKRLFHGLSLYPPDCKQCNIIKFREISK